ncbi:MAG: hypothetical protein JM57_09060 [Comamonadaceae bacterium BICA1-1]|nr:MAG: hypothetical protein JM57_09060 [Comamonadaceae bacterium BICA1-1]
MAKLAILPRWRSWWLRRLPAQDQTALQHGNLYLLPTRAGWMLALTLLLILLGSINYQLNLGYLLTFMLAGSAAAGVWVGHRNLAGLQLSLHLGEPVFAGQSAAIEIQLHNPSRRARYAVGLQWLDSSTASDVWADVGAQDQHTVHLAYPTQRRGRHSLPALRVQSVFPLGTFRVWNWWRPVAQLWVYPAPETPAPPLPLGAHADDGPAQRQAGNRHSDEAQDVRPYRRGDPLKWVLWKKAARLAGSAQPQWLSRDFGHPSTAELWLDASRCGLADEEARRARLCAWVLQAEAQGLRYGLRLPGLEITPDHGPAQRRRCLEALAWR